MTEQKNVVTKQKKFPVWVIIAAVAVLAVIATTVIVIAGSGTARKVSKQLELARKYAMELNYEQAVIAYEAVIKIDPKNTDAYLELADVYVEMGQPEKAEEVLKTAAENVEKDDLKKIDQKIEEIEKVKNQNTDDQGTTMPVPTQEVTPELTAEPNREPTPEPAENESLVFPIPEIVPTDIVEHWEMIDDETEYYVIPEYNSSSGLLERVIRISPVGGIVDSEEYEYYSNDILKSKTTIYNWDKNSWLNNGEQSIIVETFDEKGIKQIYECNNYIEFYSYSGNNVNIHRDYKDNRTCEIAQTCDQKGHIVSETVMYSDGQNTSRLNEYEFYDTGIVKKEISTFSSGRIIEILFNETGAETSVVYEQDGVIEYQMSYSYDSAGRVVKAIEVFDGNPDTFEYEYIGENKVVRTVYGEDSYGNYHYVSEYEFIRNERLFIVKDYDLGNVYKYWFDENWHLIREERTDVD